MECKRFEDKLNSSVENGLSGDELREFKDHLASCPRCARALEDLRKTKGWLGRLEEIDPPPWFEQKIMQGVRQEHGRRTFWQKVFQPLHIKLPVQALATAVVVIIAIQVFRAVEPEVKTTLAPAPAPAPVAEVAGKTDSAAAPASAAPKATLKKAPIPAAPSEQQKTEPAAGQPLKKDEPVRSMAEPAARPSPPLGENAAERAAAPAKQQAHPASPSADYAGIEAQREKMMETYSSRLDRAGTAVEKGKKEQEEAPRSFDSPARKKARTPKPAPAGAAAAGSYSLARSAPFFLIRLSPHAPETAMEDIGALLREFNAGNIAVFPAAGIITADVQTEKIAEISARLARFGEVRSVPAQSPPAGTGTVRLSINIESPTPQADEKAR